MIRIFVKIVDKVLYVSNTRKKKIKFKNLRMQEKVKLIENQMQGFLMQDILMLDFLINKVLTFISE